MYVKLYKFFLLIVLTSCAKNISEIKDDHANLLLNLQFAEKGDCKDAIIFADKVNLNNTTSKNRIILGKIYGYCEQLDRALACFDYVINQESNDSIELIDSLEAKGVLLLEKAEFHAAQNLFTLILEKDATRWKVLNCLAIIAESQGKTKEALDYYTMAKNLSNNHYSVLNNIALVFVKLKNYDDALITIDEALKQTSQEGIVKKLIFNKALILSQIGKYDEANKLVNKYLSQNQVKENHKFYSKLKN